MSLVNWEELADFSLFKCKSCYQRLQSPVILVEKIGNVCGGCSKKYTNKNLANNLDMETVLSIFCIPCNFKNAGCSFEGPYTKTCEHEKVCSYRNIECVKCRKYSVGISGYEKHFRENHADNILNIENGRVSLPINSIRYRNDFYLLIIEEMLFLIELSKDKPPNRILAFYYYKSAPCIKVNFNLSVKKKDFNIISHDIYPLNIDKRSCSDESNILKINEETLNDFVYAETVTICVNIIKANIDHWKLLDNFKCPQCSKYSGSIYGCSCKRYCEKCKGDGSCQACGNSITHILNFPEELKTDMKFRCKYNNCNNTSTIDQFSYHSEVCIFNVCECASFTRGNCEWEGLYSEFLDHLRTEHTDMVKQKWQVAENKEPTTRIYIQYNYIISCQCFFQNKTLSLEIKIIGPESFCELLLWELCAQADNITSKLSGSCADVNNKKAKYSIHWNTSSTDLDLSLNIKPKKID